VVSRDRNRWENLTIERAIARQKKRKARLPPGLPRTFPRESVLREKSVTVQSASVAKLRRRTLQEVDCSLDVEKSHIQRAGTWRPRSLDQRCDDLPSSSPGSPHNGTQKAPVLPPVTGAFYYPPGKWPRPMRAPCGGLAVRLAACASSTPAQATGFRWRSSVVN
jgi:hypothetical protein